jgi:hypothetical protein
MSHHSDIDYQEINTGYRNLIVYLFIVLFIFAILSFYLVYLYNTGDAQMFNLTDKSWDGYRNSTFIGGLVK